MDDAAASTAPAQIEAEIEATRTRLAGTVDELSVRLRPKEIGRRSMASAKARMCSATMTPDGSVRFERVAAIGAAIVAGVGLLVARRRRRR